MLQPQIVMVVVITASGAVAKRTVALDTPVDPKLAEFAREYLNETVTGTAMGTLRRCAATSRRPTSPPASATSWPPWPRSSATSFDEATASTSAAPPG